MASEQMVQPSDWIPSLGDASGYTWLFGDGIGKHAVPLNIRKSTEVLTGVHSFDTRFLSFLSKLVDELNTALPVDLVDEFNVGKTAIPYAFDKGKTIAGYCMSPVSYVPVRNQEFIAGLGLPSGYKSSRHREIFERLWHLVFSHWVPRSLKTPGESTAGFPTFSYNPVWKRAAGLWQIRNFEQVLSAFDSSKPEDFAHEYGVVFAYNNGIRQQVDNVGKVREVFDLNYAITGGRSGKPTPADKSINSALLYHYEGVGVDLSQFSATRVRPVQGAPYLTNLPLQAIASGHMYSLFQRFPETFHVTDIDRMAIGIAETDDVIASDISEYDRSMGQFLLDTMFAVCREYWDERIVNWAERLTYAAYYSKPVSADATGDKNARGTFIGDPFSEDRQVIAGNRSGHAWTSLIAKVMKVGDTLCVIDDLTGDVLGNEEAYLRHAHPYKVVNNGDDELLIAPRALADKFASYRFREKPVSYFIAKREIGCIFNGMMIVRTPTGYRAYHRLHTILEKTYVPERSIGGLFRPRWTVGVIQRFSDSDHPEHGLFRDVHQKVWRDHAAKYFGDWWALVKAAHANLPVQTDGLTRIDKLVLDDPDLLHYMYDESEVSDRVLEIVLGSRILPEQYENFHSFYQGVII